ncbi:UDP-N-acetylglucosamine 2-epimerase [Romboutsia lituseburensis]|uniref:UDP-N-acetylglucosamine 2-epimerase n=1 Tax=Romboutsia lituseburensis TaxID=1537 RepID=UPI00215A74BB|nr:UDP-N-acetylglucosamine 2-epimerase [Romboutsia lituseburensis]MCR8745452.1 UDP-N-acetylglucosamine 2-epimerase [Romboutsia lituseburensis]
MLEQVLAFLDVVPDYDLGTIKDKQTLFDVPKSILEKMKIILEQEKPDAVLVYGDTSTTFSTAVSVSLLANTSRSC